MVLNNGTVRAKLRANFYFDKIIPPFHELQAILRETAFSLDPYTGPLYSISELETMLRMSN
jgi:hypothetical protein